MRIENNQMAVEGFSHVLPALLLLENPEEKKEINYKCTSVHSALCT